MLWKKISQADKIESVWAGGTTTQLYISPPDSSYIDRNFDFRISSAVIELEESNFTPLPGFSRILMVLEGELEIIHEGHYSKILQRFDTDSFSGNWNTFSKGQVTDFNLIMGEGSRGSLTPIVLNQGRRMEKAVFHDSSFIAYYVVTGMLEFNSTDVKSIIQQGEMIVLESEGKSENIQLEGVCEIIEICCAIQY